MHHPPENLFTIAVALTALTYNGGSPISPMFGRVGSLQGDLWHRYRAAYWRMEHSKRLLLGPVAGHLLRPPAFRSVCTE